MKVLIVSGGKPDSKFPLQGNFEFEQAEALAACGIDVTYFAVDLRSLRRKRKYGIVHGEENGVKWYVISLPIGAIPIIMLCRIGSVALRFLFSRVFKRKNEYPDVIHAHFAEMGCVASYLSKKNNIPLVVTEHSSALNEPKIRQSIIKCAKKGYSQAEKVIAVSQPLARNIYNYTGIYAQVIPNMIKLDLFHSAKRVPHDGFHIVSTGGLVHRKRFTNLIYSFSEVTKKRSDIYLHIIGDGGMRGELETLSKTLGVDNRVNFHGFKNAEEIKTIYERCDLFVLVSATETFGVVYVEAMAAGLPVIATKCGGPEDFINKGNGVLVEVDDKKQLSEAIEYMHDNISNYRPEDLKIFVQERYSPMVVSQKIINLYNEILY